MTDVTDMLSCCCSRWRCRGDDSRDGGSSRRAAELGVTFVDVRRAPSRPHHLELWLAGHLPGWLSEPQDRSLNGRYVHMVIGLSGSIVCCDVAFLLSHRCLVDEAHKHFLNP